MPTTLGIDLGTTNTKVALIDASTASVLSIVSAPTPRPDELAGTLSTLLRHALDGRPPPQAVGIASMAETGVPLDAAGTPMGDWLHWNGHRARAEADMLASGLGWDHLVAATGVWPSAKTPLANWLWLRAHYPDTWEAMARWAGVADLVGMLLTGRLATDHTLAGRTMAYRLPVDDLPAEFDADLLREVDLHPEQLPDIVSGVLGTVHDLAWGLPSGTPVIIAGHDHPVGAYAAGVRQPGDVADSLGTAEAIMSIVAVPADPVEAGRAGMNAVVTVLGAPAILAASSTAGAVVHWWLEHESGGLDPDDLFAQALELTGPCDAIVLPNLSGRQTPDPEPSARLRVLRREGRSPAYLARAMLEGLSLHARWIAQEQFQLAGIEPAEVTVLGRQVTANRAWINIKSLVMPWPLQLITAQEPVAAGAALLAAERAGLITAAPALESRPSTQGRFTYEPEYDEAFARFVAASQEEQA